MYPSSSARVRTGARTTPTFISFDEFSTIINVGSGVVLFVLTAECDDSARILGRRCEQALGKSAAVHLMCAAASPSPTFVFYEGGDTRPLLTREGWLSSEALAEDLAEAMRRAATRPSASEEAREQEEATAKQTEHMLASEQLDHFPPFFQMARSLARDAWHAARQTAGGAPLLLQSQAAAARLAVCETCASLRGDRCVECGCFMTVKAHIASVHCPLGKWPLQ
jgi:hypothetical protein